MGHLEGHTRLTGMSLQTKEAAGRTNILTTVYHHGGKYLSPGVSNIYWRLIVILIVFTFCFTNVSSERDEAITAMAMDNFGCKNVGEVGERTLKPQIPNCGCGFYAQRMSHPDPSEERRNVTITTLRGKTIYFECKPCRVCSGLKVEQICRPKTNTLCSEECVKPCFYFNKLVKKCMPRSDCVHSTTGDPPVIHTTTIIPPSSTDHVIDEPPDYVPSKQESNSSGRPELEPHNLHSWLIVTAVVLAVAIVAVIIIILFACGNQYLAAERTSLCCLLSSSSSTHSSREQIAGNQPAPV